MIDQIDQLLRGLLQCWLIGSGQGLAGEPVRFLRSRSTGKPSPQKADLGEAIAMQFGVLPPEWFEDGAGFTA